MAQTDSARMIQLYMQYSSIALLYYDYLLTFPSEVQYIWNQRFRFSTFLYVFCRYALVANILYLLAVTNKLSADCNAGYIISSSLSVIGRACVIIVWIMRTYAVYGGSRLIPVWCSRTCMCLHRYRARSHCAMPRSWRCEIAHSHADICPGGTVPALLVVILESLLAVLTIGRCVQALWYQRRWKARKDSTNFLVLEQSILYFGTVFGFTLTALILDFIASSNSFIQKLVNALTLPISGLMTARFLLRLREWEEEPDNVTFTLMMEGIESVVASRSVTRSALSDLGEDPVYCAKREAENRPACPSWHMIT